MDKKIIHTKNFTHLGDCIYNMIMFKNIYEYLENNNIYIHFYCTNDNVEQVKDFNNSNNVIVESIDKMPNNVKIYDLWIGCSDYEYNYYSNIETENGYDIFLCKFFNNFLKLINIPIQMDKFIYIDADLFTRCDNINKTTNNKYMNIDFLINNGSPRSGQINYNINEWNTFILQLSKKYNIVTTQKVDGIKCTRDDNLNVKDIAAIALNINNFICIESGVISALYNKYITENNKVVMYNLSQYNYLKCSFPNFIWKSHINELNFLL
jgi:hypothetical protein